MMSFDECPQFYQPYDYVKNPSKEQVVGQNVVSRLTAVRMTKAYLVLYKVLVLKIFVANQPMIWLAWIFQDTLLEDWLLVKHTLK